MQSVWQVAHSKILVAFLQKWEGQRQCVRWNIGQCLGPNIGQGGWWAIQHKSLRAELLSRHKTEDDFLYNNETDTIVWLRWNPRSYIGQGVGQQS